MNATRILVVDSDPVERDWTARILRSAGYEVADANDGIGALERARELVPDMVVTDVRLRGGDGGYELIARLRALMATRHIPILCLSSRADLHHRLVGLDVGADDFVRKPIDAEELVVRVRAHVRRGRIERHLRHVCTTDELTGALNRRGLAAALERERARRTGGPLSLLMIDIDDFKAVNDDYGHVVGDAVLCAVARRLTERVRACDSVGRFGGDEFVVLLPDTAEVAAAALVRRLRASCQTPLVIERGLAVDVSFSIGAVTADPAEGPATLLRRADELMYRNKRVGAGAGADAVRRS